MADELVNVVSLKLQQGYEFLASFEKFPDVLPIVLDEPPPLGASHGPNASALLGAAVGNCLAASLLFCLRRARVPVTDVGARVTVRLVRSENGRLRIGGIDVSIEPELAPGEDAARFERCEQLFEDFCVVTQSVRQGIPVQVAVAPKRGAAAAGS